MSLCAWITHFFPQDIWSYALAGPDGKLGVIVLWSCAFHVDCLGFLPKYDFEEKHISILFIVVIVGHLKVCKRDSNQRKIILPALKNFILVIPMASSKGKVTEASIL